MLLHRQAFDVFVDYHQFYLWDRGMTDQAPEDFNDEDVRRRIKTGPHVVVIQPERNGTVPVEVEVHDADPGFDHSDWDHIAEASLNLPTGRLQVHECMGGPVAELAVEPGWYRVRSQYGGLGSVIEARSAGDHYLAVLWPAAPLEIEVVKQWSSAREGDA